MKRISNVATLWMQILWPLFAFAVLVYVVLQVQSGSPSAPQLLVLVVAMVLWRRFFAGDPYEVLEGNRALLVKKGRQAVKIPYEAIERVDVRGGRIAVATSAPEFRKFTFLPANTSYLSTGRSRKEALEQFASELASRLRG